MKATNSLSESKFLRRHPDVIRVQYDTVDAFRMTVAVAHDKLGVLACATGKDHGKARYRLSEAILRLNVRKVASSQGWADKNTGAMVPLSGHHVVKRSKSRNDTTSNLAALGQASHAVQHEG